MVNTRASSLKVLYGLIVFVSIAAMTVFAMHNGTYYDDEIYNMQFVPSNDIFSLWRVANATDVHPPGQYVINKFLIDLFGSWQAVKIFSGILNGIALAVFAVLAFDHIDSTAKLVLAILLMASSTHVLWGASVRWYAYFNPIFTVSIAIILFSSISLTKRTVILCISIVILFYISYSAFIAAPVLAAAHLMRERNNLRRRDLFTLIAAGAIGFLICLPQLNTFLHVHLLEHRGQTGSFFIALSQTATTLFVGNTVFPIAIVPAIYGAMVLALGLYFVFWQPKSQLDWVTLVALAVGVMAMVATGLGGKPRNSVFLLPLIFLLIASSVESLPAILSRGAIAIIVLFQIVGAMNLIDHRGTLKGSYDTDYNSALDTIQQWKKQCKNEFIVFHHDMVLGYLLDEVSIQNSSPFTGQTFEPQQPPPVGRQFDLNAGDCVVFVKTFRGIFDKETILSHYQMMENANLRQAEVKQFSEDPSAKTKSWILKETFPQHLIVLYRDDVVFQLSLPAWNFKFPKDTKG